MLVAQLPLPFCNSMDCSPQGPPVHGILQARILEWVAIPFSRGSFQPRDWIRVSCTAGGFFTSWVTRKAQLIANYKLALAKSIASDWTTATRAFAICLCLWGGGTLRCCSCWPSIAAEGVQGGVRHSVLQGIWWNKSLGRVRYFQELISWSQHLHLFISWVYISR